jgi:hypothetical protein
MVAAKQGWSIDADHVHSAITLKNEKRKVLLSLFSGTPQQNCSESHERKTFYF